MTSSQLGIQSVRAGRGRKVLIGWSGGVESEVDLADFLDSYEVFEPLRGDDEAFRRIAAGEWGWSVHWTDDMEIAAETLHRLALKQRRNRLTGRRPRDRTAQRNAAAALGVSVRKWRLYEQRKLPPPLRTRGARLQLGASKRAA